MLGTGEVREVAVAQRAPPSGPLARKLRFPGQASRRLEGRSAMLWTIVALLLILWVLGLVTSYTLGGFIHLLLLLAIVAVLIRIIQGRRPI
jgi:uncharacterized protein DUF5670